MKNIIHFNQQERTWSSHTYLGCERAPRILVAGVWRTECKPERKYNPRGWVVTQKEDTILNPTEDVLKDFVKLDRLMYDREKVTFNITSGEALLFDETGCYVVKRNKE